MVLHVFRRHGLRAVQSLINQNVGLIKVNWFSYCRAFAMHCESSKSEIVVCDFSFFLFIAFSSTSSFFSFCGTLNIFLNSVSRSIIWEMLKMKENALLFSGSIGNYSCCFLLEISGGKILKVIERKYLELSLLTCNN